jgi:hypothetical protein
MIAFGLRKLQAITVMMSFSALQARTRHDLPGKQIEQLNRHGQ